MTNRNSLTKAAPIVLFCLAPAASLLAQVPPADNNAHGKADPSKIEFFEKKIRPLLAANCFKCHGPEEQEAGLRLDSRATILRGGDSGPAIDLREVDESLLLKAARHASDAIAPMPPEKKLKANEVAALAAWLKMGAPWPQVQGAAPAKAARIDDAPLFSEHEKIFWSFLPVADPPVPAVNTHGWAKSNLDRFILAKLEEKGLQPAPAADQRRLIRRATYNLIGLPPTPEEVDSFLADESPDAFAKVVERLLSSSHYGERWGRHWLDVARYADSNGMDENLAYSNAFQYRDYVVAAFNKDKPYNQFVREQIAGDLMPVAGDSAATIERQVATGFLAIGPKMLAEDDPEKMRVDIIDEQIDTLAKAFMGLALGCARCHAHKFDPIPQEDYYSLVGIFQSTKTMEHYRVVASWYERVLGSDEQIVRQKTVKKQIETQQAQIDQTVRVGNERLRREARGQVSRYLLAGSELNRHRARQADLKPVLASAGAAETPGLILVEAEDFTRGDLRKDFGSFGKGIGVVYSRGREPRFAEYEVEVPVAGTFQIEMRYASDEMRPLRVTVNGKLFSLRAVSRVTGGRGPESQKWAVEGTAVLSAGASTIRIGAPGEFPYIDKLALVPRESSTDLPNTDLPNTAPQLAEQHGLNPVILNNWARYLERTKDDQDAVLADWHALNAKLAETSQSNDQSRLRLAERYQRLFSRADKAWQELQARAGSQDDVEKLPDPAQEAFREVLYSGRGPFGRIREAEDYFAADTLSQLKNLRSELASLNEALPKLPAAMGVTEGKVENARVNIRGNHINLGKEVPRQFLQIIAGENQTPIDDIQSGRLQLANWLAGDDHPLTGRVMANRIWRWHFGTGIVRTPDNFGTTGQPPVNPQLLDWLTARFVESGWSIKAMHRLIMLSATYQMSSAYSEKAAVIDPANRLHWRMNRRRLEAEAVRDALLAMGGTLDLTIGGGQLDYEKGAYVRPGQKEFDDAYYNTSRRSLYVPVIRSVLYEVFQAFDFPEPATLKGDRGSTTIAPQALFMLNSSVVEQQTRIMAEKLLARDEVDDAGRIRLTYERSYGRPPSEQELARLLEFVDRYNQAMQPHEANASRRRLEAWHGLCRVIVSASEFIYVD